MLLQTAAGGKLNCTKKKRIVGESDPLFPTEDTAPLKRSPRSVPQTRTNVGTKAPLVPPPPPVHIHVRQCYGAFAAEHGGAAARLRICGSGEAGFSVQRK